MPSAGPFRRLVDSLRSRPQLALATAGVALAAVVAGGLIALALGGERPVADDPTPTATVAAATEEATPPPTDSPSPTPTSSPPESATPSPTETASPRVSVAPTPTPAPTPEPTPEDRSWTALPPMPNGPAYFLRDLVVLEDGRVVAFRFQREGDQRVSILTIRPGDDAWTRVEVDEPFDDFTIYQWAQGSDGRLYSHSLVIDPTGDRWDVETWDAEAPAELASAITADEDGRIYLRDGEHMPRIHALDTETGTWTTSAENTVICCVDTLLANGGRIYALETEGIASYDPVSDTWAEVTRMPYHNAARAGIAPDGRIILLDAYALENQRIDAFDPTSGEWSELPRPSDAAPRWNPIFVTGPDGRLWAVDGEQAFVFLGD